MALTSWLAACLALVCAGFDGAGFDGAGFEWEGRIVRLRRALEDGDPAERVEILRELARYPADQVRDLVLPALGDRDAEVRLAAARTAGEVRLTEAAPTLLEWLADPDDEVRETAARSLGALGEPAALPSLVRALGDARADVRHAAVDALAGMDDDAAMVPLLGRLDDPDATVRVATARALARRGDARAIVPLVARARDETPEVRVAVATALGDLGEALRDARALPALLQALDDASVDVQLAATASLARLGDDDAAHALALRTASDDERVARASVAALGRIASPRALEAVLDALARPAVAPLAREVVRDRAPRDGETLVRALAAALDAAQERPRADAIAGAISDVAGVTSVAPAALALARALEEGRGDPALVLAALGASGAESALLPILERLGSEDPGLRVASVRAIERWIAVAGPDGRAADPLLEALSRAAPTERPAIARLLGRIGAARAVPMLRTMLDDDDPVSRLAAIEALGAIGEPASAPELMALLDDDDAGVRREAALALGRAAGPERIAELVASLRSPTPHDRHAILEALGPVLARAGSPIDGAARDALLDLAAGPDAPLASAALHALATSGDPALAAPLARLLDDPRPAPDAPVLAAIGALPASDDSRRALLAHAGDGGDAGIVATAALGDHPSPEIVRHLLGSDAPWPRSAAAAFAIARLARRGALGVEDGAAICARMRSRDPWTRANLAVALAAIGAGACPAGGPDPLRWIDPPHAGVVRAAAARWLAAGVAAGAIDRARGEEALDRCAGVALPGAAQRACREPSLPDLGEPADVIAWSADGREPLRRAPVALHLADGSVLVTVTDDAARVLLRDAPRGPISLDRPSSLPLEP